MMEGCLEVSIRVELKSGRRFPLLLAFTHSVTCNDMLETIKSCLADVEMTTSGSQWTLMESWHGISENIVVSIVVKVLMCTQW